MQKSRYFLKQSLPLDKCFFRGIFLLVNECKPAFLHIFKNYYSTTRRKLTLWKSYKFVKVLRDSDIKMEQSMEMITVQSNQGRGLWKIHLVGKTTRNTSPCVATSGITDKIWSALIPREGHDSLSFSPVLNHDEHCTGSSFNNAPLRITSLCRY